METFYDRVKTDGTHFDNRVYFVNFPLYVRKFICIHLFILTIVRSLIYLDVDQVITILIFSLSF